MRTFILSVFVIFTFQLFAQQKSIKPTEFNSFHYLGKSGSLKDIEPITGTNLYQEKPEFDQSPEDRRNNKTNGSGCSDQYEQR